MELKEIKPEYSTIETPQRFFGHQIINTPQKALTTASGGTLSSGGAGMTGGDKTILDNAITRIGELETTLKKLGIIK